MNDEKPLKFEEALARLERLVAEMESGKLPLDEMVSRFEEGRRLSEACAKELDAIKLRIEKVTASGTEKLEI